MCKRSANPSTVFIELYKCYKLTSSVSHLLLFDWPVFVFVVVGVVSFVEMESVLIRVTMCCTKHSNHSVCLVIFFTDIKMSIVR